MGVLAVVSKCLYIASISTTMSAREQPYSESELEAVVDEIVTEARRLLDDDKEVRYGFYYDDPPAPVGATIDLYRDGKRSELLHLQINNGWEMKDDGQSAENRSQRTRGPCTRFTITNTRKVYSAVNTGVRRVLSQSLIVSTKPKKSGWSTFGRRWTSSF